MAYINGTTLSDNLFGTTTADTIYGGFGDDVIHAGAGDDTIRDWNPVSSQGYPPMTAYGSDTVYGEGGRDLIEYSHTSSNLTLYGDGTSASTGDANDRIYSGSGTDTLVGGGGNDWLSGGAGHDVLYGDYQSGTTGGIDYLIGGTGYDTLYGGAGHDYFMFQNGDSAPTYAGSDVIMDWNSMQDTIVISGGPAVTSSNYFETTLAATGNVITDFNNAEQLADNLLNTYDYVFLTNGQQGYLFADVNYDGAPDIGMEIKGATSLNEFSVADLLNNPQSDFVLL